MAEPCGNPGAYCHCGQNCPQGFVWTDEWRDEESLADTEPKTTEEGWADLLWDCDPVLLGFTATFVLGLALYGLIVLLGVLL